MSGKLEAVSNDAVVDAYKTLLGVDIETCMLFVDFAESMVESGKWPSLKDALEEAREIPSFLSERWDESGVVDNNFTAMVMFCAAAASMLLTAGVYSNLCEQELGENPLKAFAQTLESHK